MSKKTLHLVCNAHLDPVWLWKWEEGLAETLSTFRIAADFCEENDGFVFCHNESLLYKWVGEYEPELFERIKNLIKEEKWKVIGGWYVQPDCNIPSGESFVRQILQAKKYFINELDSDPKTAVNFDPFGHSRGLVQILKKSGYTSYLFCRPDKKDMGIPDDDFIWTGFDGSEIIAHRAPDHYNSQRGKADLKIKEWIGRNKNSSEGILLWGIGNHGGGPSREDIRQIKKLQKNENTWDIKHSWPEKYFEYLETGKAKLSKVNKDLNPWAVGCYTSMALVKKMHSNFESIYYFTEKILVHAALNGLMEYPRKELQTALEDLLFAEFHDILPGSAIHEVETYSLQKLNHGLEVIDKLKARAFFSLLSGQKKPEQNEFPVFVYNPHPFDVEEVVICELQPPEPNFNKQSFLLPELSDEYGNLIEYQLEKESCNIQTDQRKRLVFKANLKASSMNRFSCYLNEVDISEKPEKKKTDTLTFKSKNREVKINANTGLIDYFKVDSIDFLKKNSAKLLVISDYADPWGMKVNSFRNIEGEFRLMTKEESAIFAGINNTELEPVRIIEQGKIRTVVEALFIYKNSSACLRYIIPNDSNEIELQLRVYWMEKDKMLKLSMPSILKGSRCYGQVAYGVQEFTRQKDELLAQKWISLVSLDGKNAISIINDGTYGFDYNDGELRLSMLRSPAYAGHPVDDVTPIVLQDRFEHRIDQGERTFRFWFNAGEKETDFATVERRSSIINEGIMAVCCYPSGKGNKVLPNIVLSNNEIRLGALKMAEDNNWLIIRLFEPSGKSQKTRITIPRLNVEFESHLMASEIKSIAVDLNTKEIFEVDLIERKLK
ncbi:glycoside hydrolase family 38 C-terminal domain-containing protein [Bacteroidota bacterium]